MDVPQAASKRRKISWTCTECRRRKKLCDRRVPNCNQCRARGETHLCKWGDDRDSTSHHGGAPSGPATLSPAMISSPPSAAKRPCGGAQSTTGEIELHNEETLVNELNRGEMHGFGETLFMKEVCSMQSDDIDTVREPPLTIQQATSLVELFVAGESFAFLFDHPLVSETLRDAVAPGSGRAGNDPLAILRHPRADVYALIIRFCTTALVSIPHSYAITLGLVNSHNELPDVIFQLDREAQRALVTMKHPTFELLQALNLAALSLASRGFDGRTMAAVDWSLRIARRLGLDRLGTVEDDEARWEHMDAPSIGSSPASIHNHCSSLAPNGEPLWSAQTFQRRDRRARNLGRLHWSFICCKDWIYAPMHGSYSVAPDSYTTGLPRPYPNAPPKDGEFGPLHAEMVAYIWASADILRRFRDLCREAEAYGLPPDYDRVLGLDKELADILEALPPHLYVRDAADVLRHDARRRDAAIMITSTLWHRIFLIHRPFVRLSCIEPARYGPSSERTWRYAMLLLEVMRQEHIVMMKNVVWVFRMIQAALVLVAHLFFRSQELSASDVLMVHENIQFVINTARRIEATCDPRSPFAGQSRKLESVLASASRLQQSTRSGASGQVTRHPAPTDPQGDSELDEHLIRLLLGIEMQWSDVSPEQSCMQSEGGPSEPLWSDLMRYLEGNSLMQPADGG